MNSSRIVIGFLAALVLGGGGFFAGRATAETAAPPTVTTTLGSVPGGAGTGGTRVQLGGAGAQGGGLVSGRVLSVNADSLTVEVRAPGNQAATSSATSSTIALVGGSTRVTRTTETDIKLSDIKAGDQVTIVGQTDAASGTVSAQAVIVGGNALNQLFSGQGSAGGRAGASGSPRPSGTR